MIALDCQPFSVAEDHSFRQQIKEIEVHIVNQRSENRIGMAI